MINDGLILLLKRIKFLNEIDSNSLDKILRMYDVDADEFNTAISEMETYEVKLNEIGDIFTKANRNYFTISSKTDFSYLTIEKDGIDWKETIIYHPLNDHSRSYLSKGDVLFCYRQGQFSSLNEALDTRGIYAVGIAATDPLVLYPNKTGHNKYGIVVSFPILLKKHLQLRNIQLHPNTIDLTPYNGNRNDALQYIESEKHYSTLLGLIIERNKHLESSLRELTGSLPVSVILPDVKWKLKQSELLPPEHNADFNINQLLKCIDDTGLKFSSKLVVRLTASLLSKPFLILTGLSGSGKTRLAQCFAKWFSNTSEKKFSLLKKALYSDDISQNYKIVTITPFYIEIINTDGTSGKKIPLPTEAVYEWYKALCKGEITEASDPKESRHQIGEKSVYQKYTQGFYSELFKISLAMFGIDKNSEIQSDPNHLLIPVGADWTNREPLLGYPNAIESDKYIKPENGVLSLIINATENPDVPYFLILDEMNLSHVERYFSDFLSAMESNEDIPLHSGCITDGTPSCIKLPDNLFIIGTVNIDETTYMFSPKVLDRANTIEFRVTKEEIDSFIENASEIDMTQLEGKGTLMAESFLQMARNKSTSGVTEPIKLSLGSFFKNLKKVGAEYGYRTTWEIMKLIHNLGTIDSNLSDDQKLDIAIMHKLLPKLHGSRRKLCPVLVKLGELCVKEEIKIENDVFSNDDFNFNENSLVKFPLSLEKITRMYKCAVDNGFASYAEA